MSFQLHFVFENFKNFKKLLKFIVLKRNHMEDPTKVQGATKSKGLRLTQNLRPTQYNDMFRMLK